MNKISKDSYSKFPASDVRNSLLLTAEDQPALLEAD